MALGGRVLPAFLRGKVLHFGTHVLHDVIESERDIRVQSSVRLAARGGHRISRRPAHAAVRQRASSHSRDWPGENIPETLAVLFARNQTLSRSTHVAN